MEIIDKISNLKKATFGVEIVTETEPAMRKTNNPFVNRVKKITIYKNAILGVDYQNAVNNRLERNGLEPNYVAEAPKGKKHYNAFFYQSLDETKFYLKIGMYKNTTATPRFVIDGHDATTSELALLKTFLQDKNTFCQKQANAGLDVKDKQYPIVTPNALNVVSVKLGERLIYQRM